MSRMVRLRLLTATVLLACLPMAAFAAPPAPDATPEQVAAEAYARMKAGDWEGAAETFDPKALASFRSMMQPLMDAMTGAAPAKDDVSRRAAAAGAEMFLAILFSPATSMEEVKALSDAEYLGRVMKNATGLSGVKLDDQQILGAVAEGPDTVHLVTRTRASAEGITVTEMEVITLNRTPAGWRLAMSGEMTGLAEALTEMMTDVSDGPDQAVPAADAGTEP